MTKEQNKSPVVHLEHNLGLESWCIKYVYEYGKVAKHQQVKGQFVCLTFGTFLHISAHRKVLQCQKCSKLYCNVRDLVKYLNVAQLINPDVATFWNVRRMLTEKYQLKSSHEFKFSAIVLSVKPKSNEAFAYRRWLYLFQSAESIDWTIELSLCERCADKKTSNYHAWSHRQWILDKAAHLLKFEMYKTEKHIRKNVHDYSCFHHRQFVLRKLYEYNFYESDETQYKEITDLANVVLKGTTISSLSELCSVLIPHFTVDQMNESKLKSFLYCINYAASDIKFSEELRFMFGDSAAFEAHRRAMVQFIFEIVRHANSTNVIMVDCWQPSSKVIRVDDKSCTDTALLVGLKALEANRDSTRKWCSIFLA